MPGLSFRQTHKFFATVLVSGLLSAAAASAAAEDWYVSASLGTTFLSGESGASLTEPPSTLSPGGTTTAAADFDTGFGTGAAVGRWLGDQFRAELEWLYRSNDIKRFESGDGRVATDGNFASSALSLNAYFHFGEATKIGAFSPYVGAGVSWVNEVDIDLEGGDFGPLYEDLEDDGIAIQMMAGVGYRQTARLMWSAELRWLSFGDADLERSGGTRLDGAGYDPFSLFLSVSYGF